MGTLTLRTSLVALRSETTSGGKMLGCVAGGAVPAVIAAACWARKRSNFNYYDGKIVGGWAEIDVGKAARTSNTRANIAFNRALRCS